MPEKDLVIHVLPGRWNLASIDPQCLAAVIYLQVAFPGQFSISEETNMDASPSGQLPYLTHKHHSISPLPSIIAYLSALQADESPSGGDPDAGLSALQHKKSIAWRAYVNENIGVLVAHSFYSLYPNYHSLTRPTLTSMLTFPARLYVPGRLREMQRPMLEAAYLWDQTDDKELNQGLLGADAIRLRKIDGEHVKRAFGKERILERAKTIFDLVSKLIPSPDQFIYQTEAPTTLDIMLASYILLVLHTPLPNPLLKTLLLESYPHLISHACLVHSRAFRSQRALSSTILSVPKQNGGAVQSLWQGLRRVIQSGVKPNALADSKDDLRKGRWGWFALAGLGLVAYVYTVGLRVVLISSEDNEWRTVDTEEITVGLEVEEDDEDNQ